MTDYVRQVVISFDAEDNTGAATASVANNYAYAETAAESFGEKAEDSHNKHDFATRRSVQAMHMLGTAIGGNLGQMVQYAGSVVQVISATNPWVAALTAVTLGIKLVGSLIDFFSKEQLTELDKSARATADSLEKLAKKFREMAEANRLANLTKSEIASEEFANGMKEAETRIAALTAEMKRQEEIVNRLKDADADLFYAEMAAKGDWAKAYLEKIRIIGQYTEARKQLAAFLASETLNAALEAARAARETAQKPKAEAAPWGMAVYGAEAGIAAQEAYQKSLNDMLLGMIISGEDAKTEAQANAFAERITASENAARIMLDIEKARYDEELAIAERAYQVKIMQIEQYRNVAGNVLGVVGNIGKMVTSSEKEQWKIRVALKVAEAGLDAIKEAAAGFAAAGYGNVAASIAHFTASAMYATMAVGTALNPAAMGMAAPGAKGGGSSYDRTTAQGGAAEDRGPQKSEVVIYINGERAGTAGFGKVVVDSIDAHLDRQNPGRQRGQVTP